MAETIVARIVRESGIANLVEILSHHIPATDLQSLLLAVFRRRASKQTPRRVLEQYERNAFVRPAAADTRALLDLDRLALELVPQYEPVELSPLAPLGTCSSLAPVDQNLVVSTIRNTEVVSDSTNVLALECALRRRKLRRDKSTAQEPVRLCASHRLVRAQRYTQPDLRAHFRMFTLCTAGRADGTVNFEVTSLVEHLTFYLRFMAAAEGLGYHLRDPRVTFIPMAGDQVRGHLEQLVIAPLHPRFPGARLEIGPEPATTQDYYQWVRFQIYARDPQGSELMIADGGLTDWTQQLLSDRRERLLTSGIATERIATLFRQEQGQ